MMPVTVNAPAGVAKPGTSVSLSTFNWNEPVPSLMVRNASLDAPDAGIVPEVIVQFAIETSCASNDSEFARSCAIVFAAGVIVPVPVCVIVYGVAAIDANGGVTSRWKRPASSPMRPATVYVCPVAIGSTAGTDG